MRIERTLVFALACGLTAAAVCAGEDVDDLIKLSHGGVSQDVMLAYVQTSPSASDLSADEIQKLRDNGVSATVIVAMLDRGKEPHNPPASQAQSAPGAAQPGPTPPTADRAPQAITPAPDAPAQPAMQPAPGAGPDAATAIAPPPDEASLGYYDARPEAYGRWQYTAFGWTWCPPAVVVEIYPRVTAASDHAAQLRLQTELVIRRNVVGVNAAYAPYSRPEIRDAREEASQRRLDAELEQRRRLEREARSDRYVAERNAERLDAKGDRRERLDPRRENPSDRQPDKDTHAFRHGRDN